MKDPNGQVKCMYGSVYIGDECWIGNKVTIQKNTYLPSRSIVASNSLINKNFSADGSNGNIYAGSPATLKSRGHFRVFDFGLQEKLDLYFACHYDSNSVNIKDLP